MVSMIKLLTTCWNQAYKVKKIKIIEIFLTKYEVCVEDECV